MNKPNSTILEVDLYSDHPHIVRVTLGDTALLTCTVSYSEDYTVGDDGDGIEKHFMLFIPGELAEGRFLTNYKCRTVYIHP